MKKKKKKMVQDIIKKVRYLDSKLEQSKIRSLEAEIERLKAEGFVFISEEPKDGADNKLVVFLHPKSTNGVLVELCQEKP